tara:strand:- start:231 stop:479 length:249 start_codon:yes stop_codon:yes gene_type:complete
VPANPSSAEPEATGAAVVAGAELLPDPEEEPDAEEDPELEPISCTAPPSSLSLPPQAVEINPTTKMRLKAFLSIFISPPNNY